MVKRIASICLAASLLASMAAPFSLAARPLTDSLGDPVLDLSFEGTLADGSTLQHPVTASEESKLTFVDGVEEGTQAVELQGAHLNLGTSVELQPQDLTLSFWLKPTQTMTGEQIITWNKNEYNADGWYLSSLNDSIPRELSLGPGSSQPYLVAVDGNRSEFFPAGEWTHIVVTYDHVTKDVKIYRNGIPQTTRIKYGINDSSTGILGQTDAMKSIGWNGEVYQTDSSHLRGALDEYRVYDEVATQKDVLALYEEMGGQVDGAEVAQADLNGLTIPSRTTENLTLPSQGASGSTIRWESSDPDVIALDGTVVRGEEDQTVTLTAYAQYQDAPEQSKEFTVVVAAQVREGLNIENSGLENVTLTDDYLVNASQQELNYLADTLDPNRFLYECYKSAGLNPADYGSTQGYPEGWERSQGSNFRSHAFGHYMSAMAMMYRSYNYSTDNAQVKTLRDKLETAVEGLKVCQQATYTDDNPDNDGFVAAFPVEVLGLADGLSTSNEPVVVPYYNLHKVLAGLLEIYNDLSLSPKAEDQTLAQDALTLAENLGTFLYNRLVGRVSKDRMLATEYGGMNDALYELYRLSGDPKHKEVAQLFDETSLFWELANGNDVLNGKHANTTIPKFIGALKRYTVLSEPEYYDQLTQEEKDELPQYLKAAESFWDTVVNHHTYVTGGNSCSEHFHAADQLYAQATGSNGGAETTCETCNTYNMLKLSRELFKVTGKKKYLDYYENTYINAILPSQNPETGMTMYFQPMAPGHNKVYSRPDTEFWCCTGTGMESFSKLGDSLYYTDENQVYVSMFFSSTFTDQKRNLKLTQTANMPNEDTVTFQVESLDGGQVKEGTQLLVRVPDWLAGPLTVEKNGVAYEYDTSYGFAVIDVAAGDEIVCTMPMEVVAYDLPDNANFVAFKYGPMVLSADLGDKDIDSYVPNGILVRAATLDADAQTVIGIQNQSVEQWLDNLAENLVRVEDDEKGRVQFVLKNTDSDDGALVYTPHYMQHGVRYGLYMYLEEPDSPAMQERILAEKQSLREEERAVSNLTNFDANNSEAAKDLKFDRSSVGVFQGRQYRHAESGGWFSYNMELDVTAEHNYLRCTYYGGDVGRSFDVYLNGEKFKTERITDENGKVFYYVVDEIPQEYLDNPNYKLNEDGTPDTNWNTAIANEAFRLSWYYGLDLSEYYKRFNTIDPMSCENECFTMKGLVYTSDGTDYTELVKQELGLPEMDGETIVRLDADKAEQYKQQAIEELTALGVTFPIEADYYISASSQTALDTANVLSQAFTDGLGDDYVKLNIKTYVSSERTEVFDPKLHSITIRGWGADYGDPQNYLGQQMYGYDNAFYSTGYNYIVDVEETDATRDLLNCYKEFTSMVEEANAISDDLDARYAAYAKAEAYLIQHGLVIPAYYNVPYCLTRINVYSKMNSMYGSQNEKMKNWETNADGYTTEEIENYVAQQNA